MKNIEVGVVVNSNVTEYPNKTFDEVQEIARQFNEKQRLKEQQNEK